jgi:hypothetical protein
MSDITGIVEGWQPAVQARLDKVIEQLDKVNTVSSTEKTTATLFNQQTKKTTEAFRIFAQTFSAQSQQISQDGRTCRILMSLQFRGIKSRHSEIKDAHKQTFEWVFKDTHGGFAKWLQFSDGIFWISGKGKSYS